MLASPTELGLPGFPKSFKRKQPATLDLQDCDERPSYRFKRRPFLNPGFKESSLFFPSSSTAQPRLPAPTSYVAEHSSIAGGYKGPANSYSDEEDAPDFAAEAWTNGANSPYSSVPPSPFSPGPSGRDERVRDYAEKTARELGSLVGSVTLSTENQGLATAPKRSPGILPALESPEVLLKNASSSTEFIANYCSVRLAGRAVLAGQSGRARSAPVETLVPVTRGHVRGETSWSKSPSISKPEVDLTQARTLERTSPPTEAPVLALGRPQREAAQANPQTAASPHIEPTRSRTSRALSTGGASSERHESLSCGYPRVNDLHPKHQIAKATEQVPAEVLAPARRRSMPLMEIDESKDAHSAGYMRANSVERGAGGEHASTSEATQVDNRADDVNMDEQTGSTPGSARARSNSATLNQGPARARSNSTTPPHPPLPIGLEHWINLGDSYFQCPRDYTILRGHRSAVRHEEKDLRIRATCEFCGQDLARRDAVLRHQKSTCKKAPRN